MAQKFNFPIGGPAPQKKPMAKPMMAGAAVAEPEEGQEPEDGAEIAQQHGPATDVSMHHEHEIGVHHVTSEHPDGHHHESDHESAEKAHEHGKKLAGVGHESSEHEQPEGGEQGPWDQEK
jgi:hypothetical protein